MALFDRLAEERPDLANAVAELDDRLRRRYEEPLFAPDRGAEGDAISVAIEESFRNEDLDRAADAVLSSSTPPAGIFGAGVVYVDEELQPALFIVDELLRATGIRERDVARIYESAGLGRYLVQVLGGVPGNTRVVGLAPPVEQLAPGDPIVAIGTRGTCGPAVTTSDGERAVLTAGHVATPVEITVDSGGERIGRVAWSDSLSQHGPGEVCADVAVVVLRRDVILEGGPPIRSAGAAAQLMRVAAYARGRGRADWLRGLSREWALDTTKGSWKEIAITSLPISDEGDSGAPVLVQDGDVLVGMIVGGNSAYSVIQDISVLLEQTGTTLVTTS